MCVRVCVCLHLLQLRHSGNHSGVRLQLLALWPQDCPSAERQITVRMARSQQPEPNNSRQQRAAAAGRLMSCGRRRKKNGRTEAQLPGALEPSSCDKRLSVSMATIGRRWFHCDTTDTSSCSSASGLHRPSLTLTQRHTFKRRCPVI